MTTTIGDFLDTITAPVRAVVNVVSAVTSSAVDVVTSIPGIDFASEQLVDFAKTGVGKTVLKALASSLHGVMAPILGPQLATIAWAAPGLFRGETFSKAWFSEFSERVNQTAAILGADFAAQMVPGLAEAIDKISVVGADAGEQAWQIAIRLAIPSEEATAWAMRAAKERMDLYIDRIFDPATGKDLGVTDEERQAYRNWLGMNASARTVVADKLYQGSRAAFAYVEPPAVQLRLRQPAATPEAPIRSSVSAEAPPTKRHDTMLAVVVLAAGGALVWWYAGQKGRA